MTYMICIRILHTRMYIYIFGYNQFYFKTSKHTSTIQSYLDMWSICIATLFPHSSLVRHINNNLVHASLCLPDLVPFALQCHLILLNSHQNVVGHFTREAVVSKTIYHELHFLSFLGVI